MCSKEKHKGEWRDFLRLKLTSQMGDRTERTPALLPPSI